VLLTYVTARILLAGDRRGQGHLPPELRFHALLGGMFRSVLLRTIV
jgi:hypothetical protein